MSRTQFEKLMLTFVGILGSAVVVLVVLGIVATIIAIAQAI